MVPGVHQRHGRVCHPAVRLERGRFAVLSNGYAAVKCHPDKILLLPAASGEFPAYFNRRFAANIGNRC
jgi:hypothetical protein